MADYINKASESNFIDLAEDNEFKKDLVRFFSGGRYRYSKEDMREKGYDGLTKDFIEHMRYQSWNEVEALRDLDYVTGKDYNQEGKEAFGRLMQAWDTSDAAGTGFFDGAGDIGAAMLTAPSTYVGLGSFGLGKLAAKGALKANQILLRKQLTNTLKKNVVNTSIKRQAVKEAGIGAASGAVIGGGQAYLQGETREEAIEGYEYTTKDLLADATIAGVTEGALGAGLGYASGLLGRGRAKKVDELLTSRTDALRAEQQEKAKEAIFTLNNATAEQRKAATARVADLEDIMSARAGVKGAKLKDRLDPERVAKGRGILNVMTNPQANPEFASGLSIDTMRKVAAASIDLMNRGELNIKDGERITESVSFALRGDNAEEAFNVLEEVRSKYGLSKDEFSLIYLSEVSRAGQTLGYASAISRGANLAGIDDIFAKGASSLSGEEMTQISREAVRRSNPKSVYNPTGIEFWREVDAMRIAFMTSQPVTTMRNLRNAGILVGVDMLDSVNKTLYKGLSGDVKAVKDFIPNMTAVLRGYSTNKVEATVLRQILMDEAPEQYKRLFNDAMRVDVGLEGQSVMAKAGRVANVFNTATDSILKEGMFFGSLDRQFREVYGVGASDWLRANKSLDDLPEGIDLQRSIDEANRLTMQKDFRGDNSALATATKDLVNLNRKVPFLISQGAGVPFPRYVGNHLQMVADYTPIVGEILHQANLVSGASDTATRTSRQMSGAMLLLGGYQLADMRDGEVDYGSIKDELGKNEDMKPYLGAVLFHTWLGDKAWRYSNGLPMVGGSTFEGKARSLGDEMSDVFGGIPDFQFDLTFPAEFAKSVVQMETTEELEKAFGNFFSTFTYPTTIARDIYEQLDPDSTATPFVRDLALQSDVSTKGTRLSTKGIALGQTTRFLPDTEFIQYTQSFDGEYDVPYYKFSNPVAVGSVNPMLKQISGSVDEPPLTGLEMEMNRNNLKDWQLYNSKTVPNANIDMVLRARLARGNPEADELSLAEEFEVWRKEAPASKSYGDKTYDEIPEGSRKAKILEGWIKQRISEEQKRIETMFNNYLATNPYKARGFVRNNYMVTRNRIGISKFNEIASTYGYESADDMISSAETVNEEIERRMMILGKVPNIQPDEPY